MSNRHVQNYGVWKAQPLRFDVDGPQDPTPHIQLFFQDDDGEHRAAINVKSSGPQSQLVYWLDRSLRTEVTERLESLDTGFHRINGEEGLDYFRDDLIIIENGRVLPARASGPDNDILDQLVPILNDAINSGATIYLFGAMFNDRNTHETGIHDIHMNQGSLPRFENGVNQDGGFFLQYADGHWEGVFLAFASQKLPTDDKTGLALPNALELIELIEGSATTEDFPSRRSKKKRSGRHQHRPRALDADTDSAVGIAA